MGVREVIVAHLGRAGVERLPPLAVDVLAHSGVRSDQAVPGPGEVDAAHASLPHRPLTLESRYSVGPKLGEGGMGVVHLARDRNLGRDVALKSIPPDRLDSKRLARFVQEARITAQLEHPGIVPVHDLFISAVGDVYYSMKRVQGHSLAEVLDELRAGDPATQLKHNLIHLLGIFRTACQAVAYAHTRRVIHRDLKPANIMLGDFGEVQIMDWGVARLLDDAPEELIAVEQDGASLLATADGAMVGSPAYMPPEQFTGDDRGITAASDVYALGVILYELLSLERPYKADTLGRLLYLAAKGELQAPSAAAPLREIPGEVEMICLRALARDPALRYPDAGALTAALEGWLEGVGPRHEADRLVGQGRELLLLYRRRAGEAEESVMRVRSLQTELQPWDPLPMKRLAWEAEQERDDAIAEADRVFGDCEAAFESALSHVTNYGPGRSGLAELFWIRFEQAEAAHDARWKRRWEELIRRWAPDDYTRRLKGDGTLTVTSTPDRGKVLLAALEDVDGRRVPGLFRKLGKTAVQRATVGMGSYELRVSAPGHAPVRVPLVVRRIQNVEVPLHLVRNEALRPGFVHIPGGAVTLGGDVAALSGLGENDTHLPDFAIAVYPVTVGEYLEFLSALTRTDPALARLRSPRPRGARGGHHEAEFLLPADGCFTLPFVDQTGAIWQADQPIVSISIEDARHYAAWLSDASAGAELRLPTELEWEKAARGADGRIFPWGDRFDASFCVMSESRPEPPDLPRIGEAVADSSPYGVRDLAGGVRDWVEWSDAAEARAGRSPLRGGSYGTVEIYCRCASRSVVESNYVGSHVGFRLAHGLTPLTGEAAP